MDQIKQGKNDLSIKISNVLDQLQKHLINNYSLKKCSKCNDNIFEYLESNSQYSGIKIKCYTCKNIGWIKLIKKSSSKNDPDDSTTLNITSNLIQKYIYPKIIIHGIKNY